MEWMNRLGGLAVAAALLTGMAVAQAPPADAPKSAQAQFNEAKTLYDKDMGYYADAAVKLREQNKRADGGMACSYADLIVVSLGSAQVQLKIMIDLINTAHQDAASWQAAYDDNAQQLSLRKASFAKSGC